MIFETCLVIGSAATSLLGMYGNWKTGQELFFGDPVKKRLDQFKDEQEAKLQNVEQQFAAIQKVNEQLLYAANRDGLHWLEPPANLPELAPSVEELAAILYADDSSVLTENS